MALLIFYKGKEYWRFDNDRLPPVKANYPKLLTTWKDLPTDGLDAALQYSNGYTYFFKVYGKLGNLLTDNLT